jgi:hypothetical protein
MPATMTPPALLTDLAARGFTVRAILGSISVTPASALRQEDRDAIRASRAGLLAILSPAEPWDSATAIRLTEAADALVGRLGVDGRHPDVQAAAGVVVSALAARDLETVRFAVAEFVAAVRAAATARPRSTTT